MPDGNDSVELKALFDKPPKEVVEFFERKKVRGKDKHWNWSDTMRHAHDQAFVVSKITRLDVLGEIKKSLNTAIAQGLPYQSFANSIIPMLRSKGFWGTFKAPDSSEIEFGQRRLRQIYNVNLRTAYDAGKHARMMENAELTPYWRYRSLPPGPNRREAHQRLNNLVFRYDDPFWATHKPSNGWGCKCDVEALDKRMVERIYKRPVEEVVKVSAPSDFTSKTLRIQGKDISVVGYKTGGGIVFPDAGWDYAPGDFAWRRKSLLADKILALPKSETRSAFEKQLTEGFKKDFADLVALTNDLKLGNPERMAVGIISEDIAEGVSRGLLHDVDKKVVEHLDSQLLLVDSNQIAHALRQDKVDAERDMPVEMLQHLPELLTSFIPSFDAKGLLYHSEIFLEDGKQMQWRLAFHAHRHGAGAHQLIFRTAGKVNAGKRKKEER